jgi:peptide/nickel transport system substrate-binding protein
MPQKELFRRHPLRLLPSLALIAVAVVALSGCTSAVQQSSGPSDKPAKGGILHIVQATDVQPATLFSQNNPNFSISRTMFNSLVDYNHKTLKPEPELATSWKFTNAGKTLTFQLRKGVTFQNGRAFTSKDVASSISALQLPQVGSQTKHIANQIASVETPSDYVVTINFKIAMSNTMDMFLMMPIIDGTDVAGLLAGKDFNGTGPFEVKSYNPTQGFVLVRNPHYWKKGLPYLSGVDINVVNDSQSMVSSLKAGQSQLALDLASLDASTLKDTPGFEVVKSDADDSVQYIGSNVTIPLLSDKRVREAVSYAINRKQILSQVDAGIGQVTSLPWAPSSPAYDKATNSDYAQNLPKAKQLLASAGATGAALNVYYDAGFQPSVAMSQIIQYDLTQAGLKPTIVPLQSSDFLTRLQTGGFDGMFITGHGFGQLNPATLLEGAFPFRATNNASSFVNPQYQALANQVWQTDGAPSKPTLDAVNKFLLDQQFVSDLVTTNHTFSISTKLRGLSYTMLDYLDLDSAYLTK